MIWNAPLGNQGRQRRTLLQSCLGLVVGLAFASVTTQSASAQPERGPGDRGERCLPAHIKKQLPTFDTNNNGRLDPEEHRAMREAERRSDLATYDIDGDGKLSKAESADLHHGKLVGHFEELDTDKNAEISATEANGSCTPIEHDFNRIDADGNGSISWAEFEFHAPKGPPPRHHGPQGQRRPSARQ
jgi:Ca2+-binding EF-hand superfamily protein